MKRFPKFRPTSKIFSEMAVNMSRAGAEGGFLEERLTRVAKFTEQQAELKSRTVGALIYPAVLATIGTIVVAVLIVFFVPKFGQMFDQLRAMGELPAITDWLLWFSDFVRTLWSSDLVILIAVFVCGYSHSIENGAWDVDLPTDQDQAAVVGSDFSELGGRPFLPRAGHVAEKRSPDSEGAWKSVATRRETKSFREAIEDASENITSGESLSVPLREVWVISLET